MFSTNTSNVAAESSYRYWRLENTTYGSGSAGVAISEWQITTSDSSIASLSGKTITNLGGAFSGAYPMSNINDGIVETSNANNIGFVPNTSGYMDLYVDLGLAKTVTAYRIAPQGVQDTAVYNTPTEFQVKASNDASTWETIATFTSISTSYPNWNAGTYRTFSW
jgi:hypothetical protein